MKPRYPSWYSDKSLIGGSRDKGSIPSRSKRLLVTGSAAHPASHSMGTGFLFPEAKVMGPTELAIQLITRSPFAGGKATEARS